MLPYDAWFKCSSGCSGRYEVTEIIYQCPVCNSLLEVAHNTERLKKRSPSSWMNLFDKRYMRTEFPDGSGVWGKKELVCPNIDGGNVVSLYEGGTNLFWAERLGSILGLEDLWVKQCGNSHTGSFKDLGMTVLVSAVKQIMASGSNLQAIVCASTGDTSASLAAYCAAANIPAIVILPRLKVSAAQLNQPIANGAITLALDTDFDGCMEIVKSLSNDERFYLANSMNSLRVEGQKTVSFEIVQQFDWEVPDWIVVPGGNLGNITAIGRGFQMMKELGITQKLPRLACAQSEAANPLYLSFLNGFESFQPVDAKPTLASAIQIGNPVSSTKAIDVLKSHDGVVEQATEDELSHAAALADSTGLYSCPQTGVALAALMKLVDNRVILPRDRVVVISTASGLKFNDFKIGYHAESLPHVVPQLVNRPIEMAAQYEYVDNAITSALGMFKR